MQTFTIREALLRSDQKGDMGGVYVISDRDCCFYVGISHTALFRLHQHLGNADSKLSYRKGAEIVDQFSLGLLAAKYIYGPSHIGMAIISNVPSSLEWAYSIHTLEDCLEAVDTYLPAKAKYYERELDHLRPGAYSGKLATIAETALIEQLQPCLNSSKNPYKRKLPSAYVG